MPIPDFQGKKAAKEKDIFMKVDAHPRFQGKRVAKEKDFSQKVDAYQVVKRFLPASRNLFTSLPGPVLEQTEYRNR